MDPLILGSVIELGRGLIDKIFPDKEKQAAERAQAELALMQANQEGELKRVAQQMSAIIAEAQSPDPWTSRARPSFMYVMYILMLMSIPMGILSAFKPEMAGAISHGVTSWLSALPDSLYTLFGVGYLGYTGARTLEKNKGSAK